MIPDNGVVDYVQGVHALSQYDDYSVLILISHTSFATSEFIRVVGHVTLWSCYCVSKDEIL